MIPDRPASIEQEQPTGYIKNFSPLLGNGQFGKFSHHPWKLSISTAYLLHVPGTAARRADWSLEDVPPQVLGLKAANLEGVLSTQEKLCKGIFLGVIDRQPAIPSWSVGRSVWPMLPWDRKWDLSAARAVKGARL